MGVWTGERQIGHSGEVGEVGGGTTRIGSCVRDEIGGEGLEGTRRLAGFGNGGVGGEAGGDGGRAEEARETVFVILEESPAAGVRLKSGEAVSWVWCWERPETIGGGSSRPSAAFLDSCLAKSLACHHSKNFSAKILVGRRSFRLANSRVFNMRAIIAGLKMLLLCPGRAPGPAPGAARCSASAIAR